MAAVRVMKIGNSAVLDIKKETAKMCKPAEK
jgi:hypothetical protein